MADIFLILESWQRTNRCSPFFQRSLVTAARKWDTLPSQLVALAFCFNCKNIIQFDDELVASQSGRHFQTSGLTHYIYVHMLLTSSGSVLCMALCALSDSLDFYHGAPGACDGVASKLQGNRLAEMHLPQLGDLPVCNKYDDCNSNRRVLSLLCMLRCKFWIDTWCLQKVELI